MSDAQPRRGARHVNVGPAAVVAEPEGPKPVLYRVPDSLPVRVAAPNGEVFWPGEEFEAVYPPDQEARLIRRGQITRVAERPNDPKETD